jgi:gamma-glutamylcyclotransferase (GGCT)/AIG2-like uncharacterized protein YtfP
MPPTRVFVYGTLKRQQAQNHLLDGQLFVREARTLPRCRLYDTGRYPCLVEDRQHGLSVRGEVWEVDAATLQKLDAYEGVPHLYTRRQIALEDFPGPVLAYFFTGDVSLFPDCGDNWLGPSRAADQGRNSASSRS